MNVSARTLFVLLLGSGFAGSALAAMDSALGRINQRPERDAGWADPSASQSETAR